MIAVVSVGMLLLAGLWAYQAGHLDFLGLHWRPFTDAGSGYRVYFPGEVTKDNYGRVERFPGFKQDVPRSKVEYRGCEYSSSCVDLKGMLNGRILDRELLYDVLTKKGSDGEPFSEILSKREFVWNDHEAVDLELQFPLSKSQARVILVDSKLYIMEVAYQDGMEPDVERFFESFELLDPS
ncbi:MAG: hypothetical protein KDB90_07120 [Planctomycetes bacterium]|nr:hypothetical protein [Planctomycetota bacterium]